MWVKLPNEKHLINPEVEAPGYQALARTTSSLLIMLFSQPRIDHEPHQLQATSLRLLFFLFYFKQISYQHRKVIKKKNSAACMLMKNVEEKKTARVHAENSNHVNRLRALQKIIRRKEIRR